MTSSLILNWWHCLISLCYTVSSNFLDKTRKREVRIFLICNMCLNCCGRHSPHLSSVRAHVTDLFPKQLVCLCNTQVECFLVWMLSIVTSQLMLRDFLIVWFVCSMVFTCSFPTVLDNRYLFISTVISRLGKLIYKLIKKNIYI